MTKNDQHKKSTQENLLSTLLEETEFVIFDLEATGGNPLKSGLTEVFALSFKVGSSESKSFHSLINPRMRIPSIVRKLTQITNEMVKEAPIAEKVMPDFFEFIKGKVLVSHNTLCDIKFLDHYSRKLEKRPLENFFLCTHLLSEKLIPESKQKSLSGLCSHLGISLEPNHRAEEDTICTKELFSHILEKLKKKKINSLQEAINFQGDLASAIKIGWKVPEIEIKQIPKALGVLSFQGSSEETLFSFGTKNSHQAFHKLKDLSALPKPLARALTKAHHVNYTKQDNLLEAKLATLGDEEKNSRALEALKLEVNVTFGLAVTRKDEKTYEVSVTRVKEKNLFFYGPFSHYRAARKLLDFLATTLFHEKPKRDKILLSESNLNLLLLVLNKEKYRYLFKSFVPHIKTQGFSHYIQSLRSFSYLERSHKELRNLREESGILYLESERPSLHGKVYCIHSGSLGESLTITTAYDSWLTSRQGTEFIKKFLFNTPQSRRKISHKPLSKREASVTNLVLWFSCLATPRKQKKKKYFTPEKKLGELIKNT